MLTNPNFTIINIMRYDLTEKIGLVLALRLHHPVGDKKRAPSNK